MDLPFDIWADQLEEDGIDTYLLRGWLLSLKENSRHQASYRNEHRGRMGVLSTTGIGHPWYANTYTDLLPSFGYGIMHGRQGCVAMGSIGWGCEVEDSGDGD